MILLFSVLSVIIAISSGISFGQMCTISILLFFVLIGGSPFLVEKKYQHAITSERVFARRGIGTRKVNEIPLEKVVNTTYNQGLIGRLLNFGNLQFNSAAGADYGVVFTGVKNVKNIDQKFKNIRSTNANKATKNEPGKTPNNNPPTPEDRRPTPPKPTAPKPNNANISEKYCKHCGNKTDAEAKYCESCGGKIA